jgi:hypothetical protein
MSEKVVMKFECHQKYHGLVVENLKLPNTCLERFEQRLQQHHKEKEDPAGRVGVSLVLSVRPRFLQVVQNPFPEGRFDTIPTGIKRQVGIMTSLAVDCPLVLCQAHVQQATNQDHDFKRNQPAVVNSIGQCIKIMSVESLLDMLAEHPELDQEGNDPLCHNKQLITGLKSVPIEAPEDQDGIAGQQLDATKLPE